MSYGRKRKANGVWAKLRGIAKFSSGERILSIQGQSAIAERFCNGASASAIACSLGLSRDLVESELVRQKLLTIFPDGRRTRNSWQAMMRDRELTEARVRRAGLFLP